MKKKVLFLDLPYHKKTKSSLFLIEILKKEYEIDIFYYNPELDIILDSDRALQNEYDFLVFWQIMPGKSWLSQIRFQKGVLFPMYDYVVNMPEERWRDYYNFVIINFSKTLHNHLLDCGYCSKYIQYFPEVTPLQEWGSDDSLFFWQRTDKVDTSLIFYLCKNLNVREMHIHKALDPGYFFVEPQSRIKNGYNITYSEWFENKSDMTNLIEKSSYYVAPRLYEGIGMSFLEAMASGRCVIAPNYPTMNEYIINGETGLLYDYDNPIPFSTKDVQTIQRNTYEYMLMGYQSWEEKKYRIIEWMEEEITGPNIENVGTKVEQDKKLRAYFRLLNRWLMIKNKGVQIQDYFLDSNIRSIAIYGCGEIAERLLEELEDRPIEIRYVIDKTGKQIRNHLPVKKPDEPLPEVDAIVVTPISSFIDIYSILHQKTDYKIISMSEIIAYFLENG